MNRPSTGIGLQTEYEFTLPRGYIGPDGTLHKKGVMRLATAMDEIAPLRDPRVRANQAISSSFCWRVLSCDSARSRSSIRAPSKISSPRISPIFRISIGR